MADIASEIKRRRTFAIISHPDAGKTTLTEKFLLYAREGDGRNAGSGRLSFVFQNEPEFLWNPLQCPGKNGRGSSP